MFYVILTKSILTILFTILFDIPHANEIPIKYLQTIFNFSSLKKKLHQF